MKEQMSCGEKHHHEGIEDQVQLPSTEHIERLANMFSLFGDPARLKIVFSLMDGEKCVCDLQSITGAMQSATSHHLRLLKDSDIVRTRRDGKSIFYSLADEHISEIIELGYIHIQEKH